MKKAELEQYVIPTLPKSRRDVVYHVQSVQYIVRSSCSPDKKTLIVAFYDRKSAANGSSLPVGVLYLRKDEYLTKTIANGEVKWRECRIKWAVEIGYGKENVSLTQADRKRILAFLPCQAFSRPERRTPILRSRKPMSLASVPCTQTVWPAPRSTLSGSGPSWSEPESP